MKGLLFLNGEPPKAEEIRRALSENPDAAVYCTDGAYGYLSDTALPHTVVGDFDSFDEHGIDASCEKVIFGADKDFTDGVLAVKIMHERGIDDIDIYGAYGNRPDMAESNYSILAYAYKKGIKARFCGDMNTYLTCGTVSAHVKIGATVSVVPYSDKLHILYTKGLKYTLEDYDMYKFANVDAPDYIMGVSNESAETVVEISVSEGLALIFIQEGR